MWMRRTIQAAALACGFLAASSTHGDGSAKTTTPLKVLFIGNSYTNHNELPTMVSAFAGSDPRTGTLDTDVAFMPGATLRRHWRVERAVKYMRDGQYTHVVLQGHSLDTIERPEELETYVRRFADVAAGVGTEPVLFATWARHRENPLYVRGEVGNDPAEMQATIDRVYGRIAGSIGAEVAPVGRAWRRLLTRRPEAKLHRPDGSHPTRRGSYLAACVLYGTLTGVDPAPVRYRPDGMSETVAKRLREAASATLNAGGT